MSSTSGGKTVHAALCGDFNQRNHSDLLGFGLQAAVYTPTHRGHPLDRIYTTAPLYTNTKVVEATVRTEHKAVVARSDPGPIINFNKSKQTVELRRRSP